MMRLDYFRLYPTVNYSRVNPLLKFDGGQSAYFDVEVTDLLVRHKIRDAIINDVSLFYPYLWKDDDKPDNVAERYYGSAKFFWVVFYSNQSFDLNYDFPIPSDAFPRYLLRKYYDETQVYSGLSTTAFGNLSDEQKAIHAVRYTSATLSHYEIEDKYIVDSATYTATVDPTVSKREVTIYTSEFETNEKRREVQLLDSDFLGAVVREFRDSMAEVTNARA